MAGTLVNPAVATDADAPAQQSEFDFMLLSTMVEVQRKVLKLNAKQASAAAGVDPSKLSTLKKGGAVSLDNVCRLCTWLQLPLDLFRVREMTPAARKRFDRLVELYASPDDVRRRLDGLLAAAPMAE